jgi:hypothetical protein
MMQFINMTPHAIALADEAGNIIRTIEPSGSVARMTTSQEVVGVFDSIPFKRTVYGEIQGLPAQEEGVMLVVSTLIASAARRSDVVSPDTGPTAVRENGQVKAVRAFQVF